MFTAWTSPGRGSRRILAEASLPCRGPHSEDFGALPGHPLENVADVFDADFAYAFVRDARPQSVSQ